MQAILSDYAATPFPFFALPREIRDEIYFHLLRNIVISFPEDFSNAKNAIQIRSAGAICPTTSVLRVSRTVNDEYLQAARRHMFLFLDFELDTSQKPLEFLPLSSYISVPIWMRDALPAARVVINYNNFVPGYRMLTPLPAHKHKDVTKRLTMSVCSQNPIIRSFDGRADSLETTCSCRHHRCRFE